VSIDGVADSEVDRVIRAGLAEDLADGPDVTSLATIPADHRSQLDLVTREPGVVAGLDVAGRVFEMVGPIDVTLHTRDGQAITAGEVLLSAQGPTRDLLTAERTALNLLTHLSGIATATQRWAQVLGPDGPRVRDTRKTLPGLRALQKYAVRCGGGVNHRMSLSDAALIKDNHVVAAGGVAAAFRAVREQFPGVAVEVEVDSLEQLTEVLEAGADLVLLDNFTADQMRQAVELTGGRARLEASGGLTFDNAAEVATTGVDYVAVGALTHSVKVLDIGADLQEVPDA
jgi:nicotinate-nucleotide pyrophosphorylase (carboxylating)